LKKVFNTFASQKPPFGRPAFLLVPNQNFIKNREKRAIFGQILFSKMRLRILQSFCLAFFKKRVGV